MCTALRAGWGIGQSWIEMGAWTGNKETKLESYINTDQSMNAVHWIHKLFIWNFSKRKMFFFFPFLSVFVGKCKWALIALEGLSIVSVCFTKSGLILSDEDVYRQKTGLYNGKAIPPPPQNDILPREKKENVVNSGTKVKRAAGGSDREALPYLWWTFILTFY